MTQMMMEKKTRKSKTIHKPNYVHVMLTEDGYKILNDLVEKLGLSRGGVIETLLREKIKNNEN